MSLNPLKLMQLKSAWQSFAMTPPQVPVILESGLQDRAWWMEPFWNSRSPRRRARC